MPVSSQVRWLLVACAISNAACATYSPELVGASSGGVGHAAAGVSAVAGSATGGVPGAGSGGTSGSSAGTMTEGGAGEMAMKPYLRAAIDPPSQSVELSDQGSLDWAHWGAVEAADYNHKAAVDSLLLDFKPAGAEMPESFTGGTTFTWSDGTPEASGSSSNGIAWAGLDEGFQLVVPAVTETRRLRVYVGVFAGTGRVNAALSDARATSKVDTPIVSAKQEWVLQTISLEYGGADQANTTLGITFTVEAMVAPTAAVGIAALTIDEP